MSSSTALPEQLKMPFAGQEARSVAVDGIEVAARVFHHIRDVEPIWRTLQDSGVESPGQNFDVIRIWVETRKIHPKNQAYVVGYVDGEAVALLPVHRRIKKGVRIYSWFPGAHVGCYAPLLDRDRFFKLCRTLRAELWRSMAGQLKGADLLYLRTLPETPNDLAGAFDELGTSIPVETLYRASFSSWAECDSTQRSKSRRKHDRQQGDRLDALGEVKFEIIENGGETAPILGIMFRQRAERFKVMGVRDPFASEMVRKFYYRIAETRSGASVRLHVLRLNSEVVAIRFNVVHGDRVFCLVSSMSEDPAIQGGSPGKQCLLRVMQSEFDGGTRVFDMGGGFTDEKRHWCNQQIELRHHYMPLSWWGSLGGVVHRQLQTVRAQVKANEKLLGLIKTWRQKLPRFGS